MKVAQFMSFRVALLFVPTERSHTFLMLPTLFYFDHIKTSKQNHQDCDKFKRRSAAKTVQEVCESQGGCPGLSILMSLTVSVDVKKH